MSSAWAHESVTITGSIRPNIHMVNKFDEGGVFIAGGEPSHLSSVFERCLDAEQMQRTFTPRPAVR